MPESAARPAKLSLVNQDSSNALTSRESHEHHTSGEIRKLTSLLEISKAVSGDQILGSRVRHILVILENHHDAFCSSVMLRRENTNELYVEASIGLNASAERARDRMGEGLVGRVVEAGRPVVVPQASREPTLSSHFPRRQSTKGGEVSVLCIPIIVNHRPNGALTVELPFDRDRNYDRALKFFSLVASMIGQAIKINRLVDAERRRLLDENVHLREALRERYDFSNLIGNGGPMRGVYEQVTQVAATSTTVMLRGESGTGKELIAHAIHYNSPRKNNPFVKVNCAALPETLIESELFGYERGVFTGAHSQKKGRFELAEGGTLFLDEIGELSSSTAAKLLRVLQEKEFERLGGTRTIRTDVRLIVATNKDLEKAIASGIFREDL